MFALICQGSFRLEVVDSVSPEQTAICLKSHLFASACQDFQNHDHSYTRPSTLIFKKCIVEKHASLFSYFSFSFSFFFFEKNRFSGSCSWVHGHNSCTRCWMKNRQACTPTWQEHSLTIPATCAFFKTQAYCIARCSWTLVTQPTGRLPVLWNLVSTYNRL